MKSLHGGNVWPESAKNAINEDGENIYDVFRPASKDFTPQIGDVYHKGPHVAYVQNVEKTETGYRITISEENAGAPDGKGAGNPISETDNVAIFQVGNIRDG